MKPVGYLGTVLRSATSAWVAVLCVLLLTVAAWRIARDAVEKRAADRFHYLAGEASSAIHKRLADYDAVLRGAAALYAASDQVSRQEWRAYVSALEIDEHFPGLQAIGFSVVVPAAGLAAHTAAIRAEGFPDYQVSPEGQRPLHTPIILLEPFAGRNLRAFGFDMFASPVRRAAIERARDTGRIAMSGMVRLAQETEEDVQRGFLMYRAIYRKGVPLDTVAERQAAWVGLVFSPFRARDLMEGILGADMAEIDFALFDGDSPSEATLFYGRGEAGDNLSETAVVQYGGHSWTLHLYAKPGFMAAADTGQPMAIAIAGVVIDALLLVVVAALTRQRRRALALAGRMTVDLRQKASQTKAILDNILDGIITIDARGTVLSMNPAAEWLFGHPAFRVIGQNVSMLMPEPHRSRHDGYLEGYLTSRVPKVVGIGREVVGLTKSGMEFPMELGVTKVEIDGQLVFVGVVRDISQRRQVERIKSEFVSTVSHELRTPLTAIRASLGLINAGVVGEVPGEMRDLTDIAEQSCIRLVRLINDILDVERIGSGKLTLEMARLPLAGLLDRLVADNRSFADQYGVALDLEAVPPAAVVFADADRLLQVLTNLVSNAVKFSPRGDRVRLMVSQAEGGWVRISVGDNGPGIPAAFQPRLFERFAQADGSDSKTKGGTGLGLSIAKALVEHMAGRIGFETGFADSGAARGTVFHVDLRPDQDSAAG